MIKGKMTVDTPNGPGTPLLFLGLSRANCERLLQGLPIYIETADLNRLGLPPNMEVVLTGGETEEAIVAELEKEQAKRTATGSKFRMERLP